MGLLGRKAVGALSAIGAGLACASPWLAGNPATLPLAILAPAIGSAILNYRTAQESLDRVDEEAKERFVLPSDPYFGDLMSSKKAIRFGYTKDYGMPVDVADGFMTRHVAIIGQSGVGKTTLGEFILWQQMARGGGFIFIDAKLDQVTRDKLGYMLSLLGRKHHYYVLNIDEPHNSNSYNPILEGDADEVGSRLLNLLPSAENSPGADFFRQKAMYALTVLTGALKSARRRYHFTDFSLLLQSDRALESLLRLEMDMDVRMTLEVFLNSFRKKDKTGASIDVNKLAEQLGGISGRLALFAQGKFGQVFNTYLPEIDLTNIVKENKCLYVMLPTMGKDQAALNLGKIILSDLRTAVYKIQGLPPSERPSPPFLVFADEMGSYVMSGIARLFEQARSAQICMIPAFQTFANLKSISPDFEDIIIGNTWTKVFFKFSSKDSPETAATILGMTKKFIQSFSLSESQSKSAQETRTSPQGNAGEGSGMSISWRQSEEYRISPDKLKTMGIGEAVVVSGSRIFHVATPMLEFNVGDPNFKIPPYKVIRHPVFMEPDEMGLDLQARYKEFLQSNADAEQSFKSNIS